MDWQAVLNIVDALGLPTLIIGLAMLSRQQRKMDAETNKLNAEAAELWRGIYDGTLKAKVEEVKLLTQDRDLGHERIRDQRAQIDLLIEQKTAAISHNQILTARIALMAEVKG